jgi:DNA-binding LacI/PurR family transcriptional regulator
MTVVKAMQILEQDGLLTRKVGSGSYAAERKGSRKVFGLLIPDLGQTEIFEPICRGMMLAPSSANYSLSWGQVMSDGAQTERETEALCRQYIEQKVSGIFFAPLEFPKHSDINERILSILSDADLPVVLLDRDYIMFPKRSKYDLISLDNRRAGYIVTEHLIKQGGKRIGFFARPNSAETVEHRIVGYREALYNHDLSVQKTFVIRGDATDVEFVRAAIRDSNVDSVMCANDHTAADLMQTLLRIGIRIPDDIRLAGVDDVRYGNLLPVPLTTFHQPCAEIGAVAMSAMLERLKEPQLPPRSVLLNGHLIVRSSCGEKSS